RDRKELATAFSRVLPAESPPDLVEREELARAYAPILALDNVAGATEIFGFAMPTGERPALVVGNERFGVADDLSGLATRYLEIPMPGRRLNTLNVAAAAAVALYYLSRGGSPARPQRSAPEARRPELLLIGGPDH